MINSRDIKDKVNTFRDDNSGSVIVTVLIAFFFLSILVAIILSTTAVNARMRSIERNTKDEFYYVEKALNDVYTGIGLECSDIMGSSYNKVLANVGMNAGYAIEKESEAEARFNIIFNKAVDDYLHSTTFNNKLDGYIVGTRAIIEEYPTIRRCDKNRVEVEILNDADYAKVCYFELKDISIVSDDTSEDSTGYVSALTTDIVIERPKLDFITVNKKGLDFAVIANDGIYFEGDQKTTINGNIYGGTLLNSEIEADVNAAKSAGAGSNYSSEMYGGININDANVTIKGNYIISGGDINVYGNDGQLDINNGNAECEVWFENLNIKSKSNKALDVKASLYALNDFEVTSDAEGSSSVIKGSYYGYNQGDFDSSIITRESIFKKDNEKNTDAKSSNSSSFIVNAKNASVDLSNIDTFVVLGKSYINYMSKDSTTLVTGNLKDSETLESVSLKANQEMYLVPTEFLNISNPSKVDMANPFNVNIPNTWFGKNYLAATPYKTITVATSGGENYSYCYLVFKDDDTRQEYIQKIMEKDTTGDEPTGKTLFNRLKTTEAFQGSTIKIGSASHIYSPNAIIAYDGGEPEPISNTDGIDRFAGYKTNMLRKYRWLDTYLDTKSERSLTNIDIDGDSGNGTEVKTYNYAWEKVSDDDFKNKGLPLSRIIWLSELTSSSDLSSLSGKVIVSGGDYTLSSDLDGFLLAKGNVTVSSGVDVNGLIYAGGKITFTGGNTVTFDTNLLEKRIAEEIKSVKTDLGSGDSSVRALAYKPYYLIYYLLDIEPTESGIESRTDNVERERDLRYYYIESDASTEDKITLNTDYRRFVTYENWEKGQR